MTTKILAKAIGNFITCKNIKVAEARVTDICYQMSTVNIRPIMQDDNAILAAIIRSVLAEFGANKPGTVYYDASTDALYELFREKKAWYFVAEEDGKLLGGAGIFPTAGLPDLTCELVKMYLLPSARGKGVGRSLIQACFDQARSEGYKEIYLETMPELKNAVNVYEKCGFKYLSGPLGNTGHFGCDLWMLKDLDDGIDAVK